MSNDVITFERVRVRASRDAEPVRVTVKVTLDDERAVKLLAAKLAMIRWQDECRRLNKLPEDGETVEIVASTYAGTRRATDPLEKAKQQLAKLSPEDRERVLRELGLL